MNHILIGAGIPFIVCAIVYAARRGHASFSCLVATPIAMALGASWAIIPDVPRLLGMQEFYLRIHHDHRINIFFWHYRLDEVETDTPLVIAGCVILIALLFAAAWRELRLRERRA